MTTTFHCFDYESEEEESLLGDTGELRITVFKLGEASIYINAKMK